jgi:hypothetical protein
MLVKNGRGRGHKGVGQFPEMTFLEGNHCSMHVILLVRCTCIHYLSHTGSGSYFEGYENKLKKPNQSCICNI